MTTVKFLKSGGRLCGFNIVGHSTCDADDIEGKTVCAAVSSAAYMTANTVIEIIGDKCQTNVSDAEMLLKVENPSEKTEVLLEGFKLHITELHKDYGTRIKIITEV